MAEPTVAFAASNETPGTTEAQFAVTPDGAMSYAIPLKVPPGTNGMQPSLSLAYHSRGGASPVGMGWAIQGMSSVQRGPRNLPEDGKVTGVSGRDTDALYLDGDKLVEVEAPAGAAFREFRTRIDTYARIRAYDWGPTGPSHLVAETRAGLKMRYGASAATRVGTGASSLVLSWLCEEIEDAAGNYMTFAYAKDGADHRLTEVRYAGNRAAKMEPYAVLAFKYREVEPYELRYVFGIKVTPSQQLTEVVSSFRGEVLRRYKLKHEPLDPVRKSFRLASIQESGRDGLAYRPLRFSYSAAKGGWEKHENAGFPLELEPGSSLEAVALSNLRGDRRQELLFKVTAPGGLGSSGAFSYDGGTPIRMDAAWAPPVDLAGGGWLLRDFNGDGLEDILAAGTSSYVATPTGWAATSNAGLSFQLFPAGRRDGGFLVTDTAVEGTDRVPLLLWNSAMQPAGAARMVSTTWTALPAYAPPMPIPVDASGRANGVYALDVNCDGSDELVYHYRSAGQLITGVYEASPIGWKAMTDPTFRFPADPTPHSAAYRAVDLNGDGCKDLLVAYRAEGQTVQQAFHASPTGWKPDPRAFPSGFVLWRGDGGEGTLAGEAADINGDGIADLFWHTTTGGVNRRGAYRGAPTSWVSDPVLAPPEALPTAVAARNQRFWVARLLGTSASQLVYADAAKGKGNLPRFYVLSVNGWILDQQLRLPVDVAQYDKADLGVRFPDLNGDGYADLAYTKKMKDGSVSKVAYVFKPGEATPWKEEKRYIIPRPIFQEDMKDAGTYLIDINGDGMVDILHSLQPAAVGQPARLEAFVNCSLMPECATVAPEAESGYWKQVTDPEFGGRYAGYVPPFAFSDETGGGAGVRMLDVNGDGLTDLIVSREEDGEKPTDAPQLVQRIFLNQIDTALNGRWLEVPAAAMPPVAFVRPLRTGMGEAQSPLTSIRDNRVELIDLDGDRLPDLVYHYRVPVPKPESDEERKQRVEAGKPIEFEWKTVSGAYVRDGGSWISAPTYAPPQRLDQDDTPEYDARKSAMQLYWQDVNGDGLVDLLYVERCEIWCSGNGTHATYLNTGKGWVRSAEYDIPLAALVLNTKGDQGFRLMDLNADGLVDVAYHRIREDGASDSGAFLNTGLGWAATSLPEYSPPVAFAEAWRGDLGLRPLDVNGDGIIDLVQTYKRAADSQVAAVWVNRPFAERINRPYKTDLLAAVEDGLGARNEVQYRSWIGVEFQSVANTPPLILARRNPVYPVIDPPMPGYVVGRVEAGGAGVPTRTTQYRYGGNRVDVLSGKSLGFDIQEIYDIERRRTSTLRFLQSDGLIGRVRSTEVMQRVAGRDVVITASTSDYQVKMSPGLPQGAFTPSVLVANLVRTSNTQRGLDNFITFGQIDEMSYDRFGNPLTVRTVYADGSGSDSTNRYADDPDRWLLGRLVQATVRQFATGHADQVRNAKFTYDRATGQLTSESSLTGTPHEVTVSYLRDVFGNKVASTTKPVDQSPARESRSVYDTLGRGIVETQNALGHVEKSLYDDVSGVVVARTLANGIVERAEFDTLQRLRREIPASGAEVKTTIAFGTSPDTAYILAKQVGNLPDRSTHHDVLGRPVLEVSTGLHGRPVRSERAYDILGRAVRTSVPRFAGEAPLYTTRRYDALDRLVQEVNPDGSARSVAYQGLTQQVTDAAGRVSRQVKDLRGRAVETQDAAGSSTRFFYDPSGKPFQTVNALGQTATAVFNLAGQRTSMIDPVMGRWEYRYNGFSELIEQIDARGSAVKLSYDALGRIVRRSTSDNASSYHYDDGLRATGRLVAVDSGRAGRRSVEFDDSGRPQILRNEMGADKVETMLAYDAYDRVIRKQFSSGLSVHSRYDEHGFWREVSVELEGYRRSVWSLGDADSTGRITEERLGDRVAISHDFNAANGQLKRSRAVAGGGEAILDTMLRYDVVGNVVQRIENGLLEVFTYDALSRLTSATSGHQQVHVQYDPLGNILHKSDVGDYQYCAVQGRSPQLCGIQDKNGNKQSIVHDMAGNLSAMGGQRVSFNAEGRVASISAGLDNGVRFAYSADGDLSQQESWFDLNQFRVAYLGDTEILREIHTAPAMPTPERTRVRHFVSGPAGVLGFFEFTYMHFPFRQTAAHTDSLVVSRPLRSTERQVGMTYFIKDHLGSLRALVDDAGRVIEKMAFDPWGKRRATGAGRYHTVRQGFTGHEHLDGLDLVHMGGRVYSAMLGRFLSPDPNVQFAGYSQSHNRYSYVLNNPLRYIDPSGYFLGGVFRSIGNAFGAVGRALGDAVDFAIGKPLRWVGEQLHKAGQWFQNNWQTVVVIAATVVLGPAGSFLSAFLVGAAIGGLSAALYGGSFEDIVRGAVLGGITGAAFYGVGNLAIESTYLAAGAHGAVGGAASVLQGGDFGQGFIAGAFAKLSGPYTEGGRAYQVTAAAVIGGTGAALAGGSFENGAITGAFSRLFNDLSCHEESKSCFGVHPTRDELNEHYVSGRGWPVMAEQIDTSWLGPEDFAHLGDDYDNIFTDWGKEIRLHALDPTRDIGDRNIYGTFSARRVSPDSFMWTDDYDFDYKRNATWQRNAATFVGGMAAGARVATPLVMFGAVGWAADAAVRWRMGAKFSITGTKPARIPGR